MSSLTCLGLVLLVCIVGWGAIECVCHRVGEHGPAHFRGPDRRGGDR